MARTGLMLWDEQNAEVRTKRCDGLFKYLFYFFQFFNQHQSNGKNNYKLTI